MLVMGFETSCDETAVSLIERGNGSDRVIGEKIKSQIPLHAHYGGVVPEIASRNHYEVIDHQLKELLTHNNLTIEDIDMLAVTAGPGLIGSLLVGLSFAKALSFANNIPLVPVDHIQAHIESAFINHPDINYPLVALVVSGGHTTVFYQKAKFDGQVFAKTRDDAVGEIFDKIAKYFGFGYPGGPLLEKIYLQGNPDQFSFTIPKMSDGSTDFSFSGYKTAVLRYVRRGDIKPDTQSYYDLIASFLHSVFNYLLKKIKEALAEFEVNSVVVAGGVSRNRFLRQIIENGLADTNVSLYMPAAEFCTDNASMVAWVGYETYRSFPSQNYFDLSLNAYSRATFKKKTR